MQQGAANVNTGHSRLTAYLYKPLDKGIARNYRSWGDIKEENR
jgi:hypothetical protein